MLDFIETDRLKCCIEAFRFNFKLYHHCTLTAFANSDIIEKNYWVRERIERRKDDTIYLKEGKEEEVLEWMYHLISSAEFSGQLISILVGIAYRYIEKPKPCDPDVEKSIGCYRHWLEDGARRELYHF